MRTVLLTLGVLAAVTGVWWMLQGTLALWPSGQMAGKLEWAYRGGGALVAGVVLMGASRLVGRREAD